MGDFVGIEVGDSDILLGFDVTGALDGEAVFPYDMGEWVVGVEGDAVDGEMEGDAVGDSVSTVISSSTSTPQFPADSNVTLISLTPSTFPLNETRPDDETATTFGVVAETIDQTWAPNGLVRLYTTPGIESLVTEMNTRGLANEIVASDVSDIP